MNPTNHRTPPLQRWEDEGGALRPSPARTPADLDATTLFAKYLAICNAALDANPGFPLFAYLLEAGAAAYGGGRLGVAVYHDQVGTPFNHFTIAFANGCFQLLAEGARAQTLSWTVRRGELEAVVANPERYVRDPALLDWDWLEAQIGFASAGSKANSITDERNESRRVAQRRR